MEGIRTKNKYLKSSIKATLKWIIDTLNVLMSLAHYIGLVTLKRL